MKQFRHIAITLLAAWIVSAAPVWYNIPPSTQAKMLGNVWCGTCSKAVYIIVESGRIQNNDLILTGRCAGCGGPVGRLIEGA